MEQVIQDMRGKAEEYSAESSKSFKHIEWFEFRKAQMRWET